MPDFDVAAQKKQMATEAAQAPRVSFVRVDGEEAVSEGLSAALEAVEKHSEADRLILEVSVTTEANLRDG